MRGWTLATVEEEVDTGHQSCWKMRLMVGNRTVEDEADGGELWRTSHCGLWRTSRMRRTVGNRTVEEDE